MTRTRNRSSSIQDGAGLTSSESWNGISRNTKSSLISIAYLMTSVNREIDLLTKNVSFEVPTQTGNYRMPKIRNKPRHLNH